MVIEVDTVSSGMPSNSSRMSSIESMATPTLPTSPRACGASESYPIWVGRSKATDRPGGARRDQLLVAAVGVGGRGEARVLAHGPRPADVHGRMHAAGERELARLAQVAIGVEVLQRLGPVDGLDRLAGLRHARHEHKVTAAAAPAAGREPRQIAGERP